jgi:Mn2+/Fe2+ NRAMP family transporter
MGKHVNSRFYNIVAWATTVVLIALTIGWFFTLR